MMKSPKMNPSTSRQSQIELQTTRTYQVLSHMLAVKNNKYTLKTLDLKMVIVIIIIIIVFVIIMTGTGE